MYPPDLVEKFQKRFSESVYAHSCEIPSANAIAKILEIAFYASMESEEGRPIKFRIGFLHPDSLDHLEKPKLGQHWLPFDQQKRYSISEVRRLAPALDYTRSFICVQEDASLISGILTATGDHVHLETLTKFQGFPLPEIFNVVVTGAGELDLNIGASSLIEFRQGSLRIRQQFYGAGDLGHVENQLHDEAVQKLPPAARDHFAEMDLLTPYPEFLARILFLMEQRRHGGSLLIVPNQKISDLLCLRIKYPFAQDSSTVWNLCVSWCTTNMLAHLDDPENGDREASGRPDENPEYPQQIFESIMRFAEFTATLSGVDGAVVISERLDLIGFGAEITSIAGDVTEVTMHDDYTGLGEVQNVEDNGMRHRSVYRFCQHVPGSTGIIVSQDGGIKIVKSMAGVVHVWKNVVPAIM